MILFEAFMDNKKLLGKRIKEIRKNCGYTQEKLAELTDIDITTLSGIESGRHFPSLVTLERIAKNLDVAMVTLFDFNQHMSLDEMKNIIKNSIDIISDDDVKLIFKLINKKYSDNLRK